MGQPYWNQFPQNMTDGTAPTFNSQYGGLNFGQGYTMGEFEASAPNMLDNAQYPSE